MADLLRVEKINKHYDGVYALRDAEFAVSRGEVHALMGENGAGKSTLAKIIAGSVKADSGAIAMNGENVSIGSPLDAQRLGIGIIYQELDLFPNLTIAENIAIGNLKIEGKSVVNFGELYRFCLPFLEQVGLRASPNTPVASLSIGQMQLVALARALSMNARLILMDEPTSSLSEDAVATLFTLVRALREIGVSIVYVSHKMDEIFRICDRITVLRDGATIGTRATAATSEDELIRMMVGRELGTRTRRQTEITGPPLLAVSDLTTDKLDGITFEVHRGEVLGIAGLVGSGRSELGAALFGLDRIKRGSIALKGEAVTPGSPHHAMHCGIGLLPGDRKLEGLMMEMNVLENSTLAVLERFQSAGFIHSKPEAAAIESIHQLLALKSPSLAAPVSSLSGGNQQKVLLSRWLLLDPDVLFLDDPARGIDVAAKRDLYGIIDRLAADGKGVILVSSELPELLQCSDRIMVLNEGRVTAFYDAAHATQEEIMASAMTVAAGKEPRL